MLFGQAGAAVESCVFGTADEHLGGSGEWEVNNCHGVLSQGSSGGPWLDKGGRVAAVNQSGNGNTGYGTPFTAGIEPEYCALAGSPCF